MSFTVSSKFCGKRMFSAAALGSNLNRIGLMPDRSNFDRSAVATNCSASASHLSDGIELVLDFTVVNFLLMHGARTDRAQISSVTTRNDLRACENLLWHDAADRSTMPSQGAPQAKLDVLGCRTEIIVRAEKDKVVSKTELYEHGVDCSNLDTVTSASVADFGSFYVVFPIRLQEAKRAEPID